MRLGGGARLLILGLDGATWDLADRFMAEGRMPVLSRLVAEGTRAPLNSTTPPMTLPSWSSMLTGCNPGKHGIFDFVRKVPGRWDLEFTNATHRRVPTLHRVLSDRGARVASVAVPTTWPPEPLTGVVIAGFDSPVSTGIDGSFCHPPDLYEALQARFGGMKFADFQETRIGPGWHEAALASMLQEIDRKEQIGGWLLAQERWDAFMLLFGESDTVSHHFWMFHDPQSPRHPQHAPLALREAIASVYARLDRAVGRLVEAAKPDVLCLCSDHGFGGAGVHVLYLNRMLERAGWLRYRRAVQVEGVRTGSGLLDRAKGFALRHIPADLQGRVVRAVPAPLLGAVEARGRYGDLDLPATRALSDEMNYAATVRLNVPDAERSAATADLSGLLRAWEVDGQPVVRDLWTREQLYWGPCVEDSPDLVLDLHLREGYAYTLLPSARARPGQDWRLLQPEEYVGGKGLGMNGTHRQHGVLLLHGRGVVAGGEIAAGMADIAPTLLHLLGESVPAHMDGALLAGALTGAGVEGPRLPFGGALDPQRSTGDAEAEAIRARLERLGYL